jgi:hypothetical protein
VPVGDDAVARAGIHVLELTRDAEEGERATGGRAHTPAALADAAGEAALWRSSLPGGN